MRLFIGMVGFITTIFGASSVVEGQKSPLTANLEVSTGPSAKRASETITRSSSQGKLVTVTLNRVTLDSAFKALSQMSGVAIVYSPDVIPLDRMVTLNVKNSTVMQALSQLLAGTNVIARVIGDTRIALVPAPENAQKGKQVERNSGAISGFVVDSTTQKRIRGVTIVLTGTKRATSTDENGGFRLTNVPAGEYTLTVRLLGYTSRTIAVTVDSGKTATVRVSLRQSSTTLSEVVTTATESQRRGEISNEVVRIDADKLMQQAPIRSVTDLLVAAQVPGLIVSQSSGELNAPKRVRIGGVGSISQNNDPVVIVDNVWIRSPFSTRDIQQSLDTTKFRPSPLDAIDPATIETIEIVKGPAAATLYGPDAANGVIKITTKRGKAGPARWDTRVYRDWSQPTGGNPGIWTAWGHTKDWSTPMECSLFLLSMQVCAQDSVVMIDPNSSLWRREGNAYTNGLSTTVSGGVDQLTYSLSGAASNQLGIRRLSGAQRVWMRQANFPLAGQLAEPSYQSDRSMTVSLGMKPTPTMDLTINLNGSQTNSRDNSMLTGALDEASIDTSLAAPYRLLTATSNKLSTTFTRGFLSANMNWAPQPWWSATATIGVDRGYSQSRGLQEITNCNDGACVPMVGPTGIPVVSTRESNNNTSVYTTRMQSTFLPNLGWASRFLALRPGITFDLQRTTNSMSQLLVGEVGSASRGDGPTTALAGLSFNTYIRLFDRISFDPSVRRDFGTTVQSSRINNSITYPRLGTSWVVSDESFFPKNRFVNSLRLRMAFGYAAVQPDLSAIRGGYQGVNVVVNGQGVTGYSLWRIGNRDLQPERSMELESGLDADLWDQRMTLTVTHSNKQNRNTLINRSLAPSAGSGNTRQENVARIVNSRTDIQLITRAVDQKNFFLTLTTGFSILDNQVKSLGSRVSPFGDDQQRYVAGYPVGGVWIRPVIGINDVNQNGILDLDAGEYMIGDTSVYVGSNQPRYTAGYHVQVGAFRLLTFDANFDYKGAYVQQRVVDPLELRGYWDPTSSLSEQALMMLVNNGGGDKQNISEMRWQSASVTLNVSPQWLSPLRARSVQVSLQGSNLGLWTRYRGRDPGVNASPVGEMTIDSRIGGFSIIPMPRSFSLQVRLGY